MFILAQLMVSSSDGGRPPFTTNKYISIQVEDVNDNAPVFIFPARNDSTLYATIRSNEPVIEFKVSD